MIRELLDLIKILVLLPFVYLWASIEIRNPLNAIEVLMELITSNDSIEERIRFLEGTY